KSKCADVITGVIQKANNQPTYNGCRTSLYGPGVVNRIPVSGWPSKFRHTCRSPNKSKWLIRNVENSTSPQPKAKKLRSTSRPTGSSTDQITPPGGRHSANIKINATLEKRTYVERSIGFGTRRVH